MTDFLDGASSLAAATIALFFLRFWRRTRDRLFVLFALAFAVFALNRIALALLEERSEAATLVYLARAAAFGLIIAAIVDKNPDPGNVERPILRSAAAIQRADGRASRANPSQRRSRSRCAARSARGCGMG